MNLTYKGNQIIILKIYIAQTYCFIWEADSKNTVHLGESVRIWACASMSHHTQENSVFLQMEHGDECLFSHQIVRDGTGYRPGSVTNINNPEMTEKSLASVSSQ